MKRPIPSGYTKVPTDNNGYATIQEGDYWFYPETGKMSDGPSGLRGSYPADMGSQFLIRPIRPIAPQGWISVKDRQPTRADYGDANELLGLYEDGDTDIFEFVNDGSGPEFQEWQGVTHWMPIPPRPQKPVIKVGGHKVDFRKNGSIKVGCTEVSSELFEQISERRKEEMA